ICAYSIDQALGLKLRNVAFVVVTQREATAHKFEAKTLAGINVLTIPTAIYANIHIGELSLIDSNGAPFGGHIIYTSGTTGIAKKWIFNSTFEDRRNKWRARSYSSSKDTISFENRQLWRGVGAKSPPAVWHVGGCVVYDSRSLNRMFRHGVNSINLSSSTLKKLLQSPDRSDPPHYDCELFVGSGFCSTTLAEEVISRVTKRVGVSYGASEMAAPPLLSRFTTTGDMHWLTPDEDRTI